jgi:hypothetical protein
MLGRGKNASIIFVRKLKGKHCIWDLSVHGRIILKVTLKKWCDVVDCIHVAVDKN